MVRAYLVVLAGWLMALGYLKLVAGLRWLSALLWSVTVALVLAVPVVFTPW